MLIEIKEKSINSSDIECIIEKMEENIGKQNQELEKVDEMVKKMKEEEKEIKKKQEKEAKERKEANMKRFEIVNWLNESSDDINTKLI